MKGLQPTRRVDQGRGHRYLLDGEPCDGVTWVKDNGIAKPALIGWAANVTADYAVDNWDELAAMKHSERLAVLKRARWADRDAAAKRGTEVHRLAHLLALGEEIDVPEELEDHVAAYLRFADDWLPTELLVEVVVGNREWRYMGTLDVVADLRDGQRWLLDFKTNRRGPYQEDALQLAAYRFADFYLDAAGVEKPMPEVDAVGIVWLHAEGYELIPVKADQATFTTFLYAKQVARFVESPREAFLGEALGRPAAQGVTA